MSVGDKRKGETRCYPAGGGLSHSSCFYSRPRPTRPRIQKFSRRKRIKPARLSATKRFRTSVVQRARDRKLVREGKNTRNRVQANDADARNRIPSSFYRGLTKPSRLRSIVSPLVLLLRSSPRSFLANFLARAAVCWQKQGQLRAREKERGWAKKKRSKRGWGRQLPRGWDTSRIRSKR